MASTATTFSADCKLMLHLNGTDESTTFTDSSNSNHTADITVNGNAQIDTADSKFGGASLLLDGTGDSLAIADSADWDLGTGNLTIDFWVKFNSVTGSRYLISVGKVGVEQAVGVAVAAGVWYLYPDGNGAGTCTTGQWYHVAIVRNGNSFKLWVDGEEVRETTSTMDVNDATGVWIGENGGGLGYHSGWFDEIRIVKGTAVWTSAFTPPAAEYKKGATMNQILWID